LIVDLDEWVDIRPQGLHAFDAHNVTIIKPQQMTLVWENDTLALDSSIPKGLVDASAMETQFYGKTNLFNRHAITDFAIYPGGHHVNVSGRLKWLTDIEMPAKSTSGLAPFISRPKRPVMYHAKFFKSKYLSERYEKYNNKPLSKENIDEGRGKGYMDYKVVAKQFRKARWESKPIQELQEFPLFLSKKWRGRVS